VLELEQSLVRVLELVDFDGRLDAGSRASSRNSHTSRLVTYATLSTSRQSQLVLQPLGVV
jgi:hypothetical protein